MKKYYIGLDVHKDQTTYAVKDWNGVTVVKGETATQFSDLKNVLGDYLNDSVVAMEACTFYYSLYKKMKENKIEAYVANVLQLRKVIAKCDKLDAERLADMLRLNSLPKSFIPDEKVQNLRIMMNLYHNLVVEKTSFQNQIHAMLDRTGVHVPYKEVFSKKGLVCINQHIHKNNDFAFRILLEAYTSSTQRIENLKRDITSYLENNFAKEYKLVMSIPGVGETIAGYLIAEICPIDRFANKKKLRRYAGVIPIREQSDKKIYATYLPKHASRRLLRYGLVLAANCAAKTNCKLKLYYQKKKKGHTHGHAVMCVASSMLDIVYKVLTTKQPYQIS